MQFIVNCEKNLINKSPEPILINTNAIITVNFFIILRSHSTLMHVNAGQLVSNFSFFKNSNNLRTELLAVVCTTY